MKSPKIKIQELISAAPCWFVYYQNKSYPVMSWARCCIFRTNDDHENIPRLISDNRILPCIFDGSEIKPLVEFQDVAWINPH